LHFEVAQSLIYIYFTEWEQQTDPVFKLDAQMFWSTKKDILLLLLNLV